MCDVVRSERGGGNLVEVSFDGVVVVLLVECYQNVLTPKVFGAGESTEPRADNDDVLHGAHLLSTGVPLQAPHCTGWKGTPTSSCEHYHKPARCNRLNVK